MPPPSSQRLSRPRIRREPFTDSDRLKARARGRAPEDRRLSAAIVLGAGVVLLGLLAWLAGAA